MNLISKYIKKRGQFKQIIEKVNSYGLSEDVFCEIIKSIDKEMLLKFVDAVNPPQEYFKNPVCKLDNKWWFHDETWRKLIGPYDSQELAEAACIEYAANL